MVDALSPQRTKATGPRIRIDAIKAKLRHTGRMKSLTLNHSLNQDHVCANRFAHIRQSLCPLSRAREALPRRLMNGRELAAAVRNITNTRCFLPHGARSVASNLRPVGALRLDVRSRIFSLRKFSLENVPRQRCFCGGPTLFL